MSIRSFYLNLRRRVVPWCMERGCWEPSHVLTFKGRAPHRGNRCAVHLWIAINAEVQP